MRRRGSLDWNLETLGKLAIAAIMLVFIFYFSARMLGLLDSDDESSTNLNLLMDRIDSLQDASEGSVVLSIPHDTIILGFDAGDSYYFDRPKYCSDSSVCLCAAQYKRISNEKELSPIVPIVCKNIGFDSVTMIKSTEQKNLIYHFNDVNQKFSSDQVFMNKLNQRTRLFGNQAKPLMMTDELFGSDDGAPYEDIRITVKKVSGNSHLGLEWTSPDAGTPTVRDLRCEVTNPSAFGFCSKDSNCADVKKDLTSLNSWKPIASDSCSPKYGYGAGYNCCIEQGTER